MGNDYLSAANERAWKDSPRAPSVPECNSCTLCRPKLRPGMVVGDEGDTILPSGKIGKIYRVEFEGKVGRGTSPELALQMLKVQ